MAKVSSFSDFLIESINDSNNIVNVIIDNLEGDIVQLLEEYKTAYLRDLEQEMNEYDIEYTRYTIIHDMVRSIEIYTQPTDKLIDINSRTSHKGNLEISAKIQRGEEVYSLVTEVIYAGGYNIQKLHYRYITKTNLPKTNNSSIAKAYAEKIKKMSKLEKINNVIKDYEQRIKKNKQDIELNKVKTPEQIWYEIEHELDFYKWPSWEEIVRRGADKNFGTEENYNKRVADDEVKTRESWYRRNVTSKENDVRYYEKEIVKLKQKLEKI